MSWTEADKQWVKELWEAGNSGGSIAMVTGRTRNAIIGMAHRNGWVQAGRGERLPAMPFGKPKVEKPPKHSAPQPIAPVIAKQEIAAMPIVAIPVSKRVNIMNLGPDMCKFPIDGRGIETVYCGATRLDKKNGSFRVAYCAEHAKICFGRQAPATSESTRQKQRLAALRAGKVAAQ